MKNKIYIYGVVHVPTGLMLYVGRTKFPEKRFSQHRYTIMKGNPPSDYRMDILEETERAEMHRCEQFWMDYMRFIGCNIMNGRYNSFERKQASSKRKYPNPLEGVTTLALKIPSWLKSEFEIKVKGEGLTASTVLREFMKGYVGKNSALKRRA